MRPAPPPPMRSEIEPKIIQISPMPNDAFWRGCVLGLGDDGVTYIAGSSCEWEPYIPAELPKP